MGSGGGVNDFDHSVIAPGPLVAGKLPINKLWRLLGDGQQWTMNFFTVKYRFVHCI